MSYPTYNNYPVNPYPSQSYIRGYSPYQAQQTNMQQPAPGYSSSSMPVGSREEAAAVPADFTGAPMIFADFSHSRIYVKQWDTQRGIVNFVEFEPVRPLEEPAAPVYVTAEDLKTELDKLYAEVEKLRTRRGVKKDATESTDE